MSKSPFTIQIPEPCSENFSEMIPTQKGRFCSSCKKTIIDFSKMTDLEIAEEITKSKGQICGQFKRSQLNRKITISSPIIKPTYRNRAASLIFSSLMSIGISNAQTSETAPLQIVGNKVMLNQDSTIKKSTSAAQSKYYTGTVTDESGEALIGVNVIIKGTSQGTTTDIEGNFKLLVPDNQINKETIFVFSYTGYSTVEIIISPNPNVRTLSVILNQGETLLGGLLIVGIADQSHETLFQKVKGLVNKIKYKWTERKKRKKVNRLTKKTLGINHTSSHDRETKIVSLPNNSSLAMLNSVFPNPFNQEVLVDLTAKKDTEITISIFDNSGRSIYHANHRVEKGQQIIPLNFNHLNLQQTVYFLKIKDEEGKIQTRKLIRMDNHTLNHSND